MKTREEIKQAIEDQKNACAESGAPHFAPMDGICWACGKQIYEKVSGKSLVTGCPHCHRSYCD